jgi:hypothetical protein
VQQEARIQKSVVDWWALACHGYKLDARLLSHCPNGGKRSRIEAAIFKGMGVRAGWPDLQLAVPRAEKHGLFLELKSPEGRMTPQQKELLPLIEAQGYAVCVAWSFEEAIGAIINYLKSGNPLLRA